MSSKLLRVEHYLILWPSVFGVHIVPDGSSKCWALKRVRNVALIRPQNSFKNAFLYETQVSKSFLRSHPPYFLRQGLSFRICWVAGQLAKGLRDPLSGSPQHFPLPLPPAFTAGSGAASGLHACTASAHFTGRVMSPVLKQHLKINK